MMSEPRFYNHLRVVIDLQRRVAQLEMAIRRYQQKAPRPPSSAPRPRKKLSKKAPAPTIKKTTKKPPLPHNVRAFKKGAQGQ
jgi:hypothetical protein